MNFQSVKVRTEVDKVYVDCKSNDIKSIQEAVWLYGGTVTIYFLYNSNQQDYYMMSWILQTGKVNLMIYGVEISHYQYECQEYSWNGKTSQTYDSQTSLTLIDNSYFLPYEN